MQYKDKNGEKKNISAYIETLFHIEDRSEVEINKLMSCVVFIIGSKEAEEENFCLAFDAMFRIFDRRKDTAVINKYFTHKFYPNLYSLLESKNDFIQLNSATILRAIIKENHDDLSEICYETLMPIVVGVLSESKNAWTIFCCLSIIIETLLNENVKHFAIEAATPAIIIPLLARIGECKIMEEKFEEMICNIFVLLKIIIENTEDTSYVNDLVSVLGDNIEILKNIKQNDAKNWISIDFFLLMQNEGFDYEHFFHYDLIHLLMEWSDQEIEYALLVCGHIIIKKKNPFLFDADFFLKHLNRHSSPSLFSNVMEIETRILLTNSLHLDAFFNNGFAVKLIADFSFFSFSAKNQVVHLLTEILLSGYNPYKLYLLGLFDMMIECLDESNIEIATNIIDSISVLLHYEETQPVVLKDLEKDGNTDKIEECCDSSNKDLSGKATALMETIHNLNGSNDDDGD